MAKKIPVARCARCGSRRVQRCLWLDINTDEVVSEGPIDSAYCPDCDEEIPFVEVLEEQPGKIKVPRAITGVSRFWSIFGWKWRW